MEIFLALVTQIIPLLCLIGLGYIAGRFMDVNLHSLAILAIYIIAPFVNFGAMAQLDFKPDYLLLPVYMFCVSSVIGISTYYLSSRFWNRDKMANLISMSSVTGNTGYFGLPIVLYLLGEEWTGIYLFMNLGMFINEIGLGYFFGARGHADIKGAIIKVLKLPVIYGIFAGLLFNMMNLELPELVGRYWTYSVGAWIIVGMMIIGIALSKQEKLEFDLRLMAWMYVPRFIIWPLFGAMFIMADMAIFGLFSKEIYLLIGIFTLVPLAGNIVAFAVTLNLHAEKAAMAVLVATLLASVTMPIGVSVLKVLMN